MAVIREPRTYLAREENDYTWSPWNDREQALFEIDFILERLEDGSVPDMQVLFAPTGPIQEVSVSNSWSSEFLRLAERFDEAYKIARNRP